MGDLGMRWKILPAFLVGLAVAGAAQAQRWPEGVTAHTSLRYDVGNGLPLITATNQGIGTLTSADLGPYGRSAGCSYVQTAGANGPSSTITIQGKQPGTTNYYSLLTSAAVTAITPGSTEISIGPEVTTSANVGLSAVLPTFWRVQLNINAGSGLTGTVNCTTSE
jgi:hypothetical protein